MKKIILSQLFILALSFLSNAQVTNQFQSDDLGLDFSYNPFADKSLPSYFVISSATIRMEPNKDSPMLTKLSKGEEVKVNRSFGDWWSIYYLSFENGKMYYREGWVYRKSLKIQ